jgi:hypothetical protein
MSHGYSPDGKVKSSLSDVAKKGYVDGWEAILGELRRIARVRPDDKRAASELLLGLPWEKVFDFCEHL